MNIEVHQPRLEALIKQRMDSGRFQTVEDAFVQALEAAPLPPDFSEQRSSPKQNLFEPVRGLLTDEEVDTLFRRDLSPGHPVDLS